MNRFDPQSCERITRGMYPVDYETREASADSNNTQVFQRIPAKPLPLLRTTDNYLNNSCLNDNDYQWIYIIKLLNGILEINFSPKLILGDGIHCLNCDAIEFCNNFALLYRLRIKFFLQLLPRIISLVS